MSALPSDAWKLEDAKARFSEVVRLAREQGPQHVSVRGRDAVVVLSAEDYARLTSGVATDLLGLFGEGPFARMTTFAPRRTRARSRPPPDFGA